MMKLLIHDRLIFDSALQHRFVEHDRQLQPVPVNYLLALHAYPDQSPDHSGRDRLDAAIAANYVPGISLGLQQAGYHINVPYGYGSRLVLKADELLVVLRKAVAEFLPPALLGRVLGEREQQLTAGPGDLVVVEQPLDLPRPQAGPGGFVPADLGGRPAQRGGDRIAALSLTLSDPAQLGGQPTPPHRGRRWRDHRASLLLGGAGGLCEGHADFTATICETFSTPYTRFPQTKETSVSASPGEPYYPGTRYTMVA